MENKKLFEKRVHQCMDELPLPITKKVKQHYYNQYYSWSEEVKNLCHKKRKDFMENKKRKLPIWEFSYIVNVLCEVYEIERRDKMKQKK